MEVFYPEYYSRFRCLAGACPDSCCKEWEVVVDESAARRYAALPGALGDRLRQVLRREGEQTFLTIQVGRCPMWRQDGLCRIQAEQGEDWLCQTCREFPRLTHDYGDFVEHGLELSCPEAARLILSHPDAPWVREICPGGEAPGYDPQDMAILRHTRREAEALVRDPKLTVGQALAVLLLYGYAAQQMLEEGELEEFCLEDALQTAMDMACPGDASEIFSLYAGLEILTEDWRALLAQGPQDKPWEASHRAVAVYLIQRYWLQAVSDCDLAGRVKFMVMSCLMIRWVSAPVDRAAQLYAKEIENDADNVDALLDAAYESPAVTDVKLLDFLLKK